jgi:hypothetical protein
MIGNAEACVRPPRALLVAPVTEAVEAVAVGVDPVTDAAPPVAAEDAAPPDPPVAVLVAVPPYPRDVQVPAACDERLTWSASSGQ